jgi:hypothetical protein
VFISLRSRIRQVFLLGCVSGAALAVIALSQAATASADVTSVYPPEAQSRSFAGGAGGWTNSKEQESLVEILGVKVPCVEGVTCPTITNEFKPAGGASNDGYIETAEGGLLAVGLLAKSSGVYESPAFTYGGAAGQVPTSLELTVSRRAELSALLNLLGASAFYTVELADQTSPSGSVVVIDSASLAGAETWKASSNSIDPSKLVSGHSYKIRIKSTFSTPALVLPTGGVGYDDVALTATKVESSNGGNGGNGNNGGGGNAGGNGNGGGSGTGSGGSNGGNGNGGSAGGVSSARLESLLKSSSLVGSATLKGNRLSVKAKCPTQVNATCTITLQGMLSRSKAATATRRARVKLGKTKSFTMVVKSAALGAVKSKSKILIKEQVRVGQAKATVYKTVKLVRK